MGLVRHNTKFHYSILTCFSHFWPKSLWFASYCKEAKLQAGIKPTALCSAIDKENSMEFLLISLPTYTLYYCGYVLILPWSSCYSSHVTPCDCDLWHDHLWPSVTPLWHCDKVTWYFPTLHLVVCKSKEKEI